MESQKSGLCAQLEAAVDYTVTTVLWENSAVNDYECENDKDED